MELTNEIVFLSIAILMAGLIFPAYTNLDHARGYNNATFIWLIAVLCQFCSSAFFASYQLLGLTALSLGSTLQFTTDVLLILLFKSFQRPLSQRAYSLAIAVTLLYWLFYDHEDYLHRTIIAVSGLLLMSAWQVLELSKILKQQYSKYLVFLILAIAAQMIFGAIRMDSALDLLPLHGSDRIPLDRFHENLDSFLIRLPIHLIYVLIFMGIDNYFFETLCRQAQKQKRELEEQAINVLIKLAAARDNSTGQHLLRTQAMFKQLAEALVQTGYYQDLLSPEKIDCMCRAAPLHDIGKVAIPDEILLKPGALSPEERELVKKHASLGEQILKTAMSTSGQNPILETAMVMAGSHHEYWDGTGYPRGLKQTQIPIEGRMMAVVDVYDALSTERFYKKRWTHEEVVAYIRKSKGIQFDPIIVAAFLTVSETFRQIATEMKDPDLGLSWA